MAQDTSRATSSADADSEAPAKRSTGSPISAMPGDQKDGDQQGYWNYFKTHDDKGFVFQDDLRGKLGSRCPEFHRGLYTFLAIGGVDANFDYMSSTWRLTGGAFDAVQEAAIRARFSDPTALSNWADLRTRVLAVCNDGPKVTLVEASDAEAADNSRCAYVNETARIIHANVRDMTAYTVVASDPTVQAAIGQSYDGFWLIIHETLHIIGSITGPIGDKWGSATAPGDIENLLNGVRKAFGLVARLSYCHGLGVRPGVTFDGGEIFWP